MRIIPSKKDVVSFFQLTEESISCWDKIEEYLNRPCADLNDLLSCVKEALVGLSDKERKCNLDDIENQLRATLKLEFNYQLAEAELSLKTKMLQEHQKQIEDLNIGHQEELSVQKGQKRDLCNTLIKIVELYDRCNDDERLTPESVIEEISRISENALNKLDIMFKNSVGEIYDSEYQNIVSVIQTNDKEKDKTVVESLSRGIIVNGKCVKVQDVIIAKYKE